VVERPGAGLDRSADPVVVDHGFLEVGQLVGDVDLPVGSRAGLLTVTEFPTWGSAAIR
jgi:hypothetical protein